MRRRTDPGGSWDVRVAAGVRRMFAIELAYVGALSPMADAGIGEDAKLLGHAIEGLLRLNVPFEGRSAFFVPFVATGLGWWRHRIIDRDIDDPRFQAVDDAGVLPVGAGFAVGHENLFFETRFMYRFTYNLDLVRDGLGRNELNSWSLGADIGFRY